MNKIMTIALFSVMAITGCSTDNSSESVSEPESHQKNLVNLPACTAVQRLAGTLTDATPGDIRGRDCKGGLGLCTPKEKSFSFKCIEASMDPFTIVQPSYDPATNTLDALAIEGSSTMKFYFHASVLSSPDIALGDWNYLDIETTKISQTVELVAGKYPMHTSGNYIVYEVTLKK